MFKIICVTNRHLCHGDFLAQLEKIAAAQPDGVILREKDLPRAAYLALAAKAQAVCREYGVPCVWHTYYNEETEFLHLPLPLFIEGNFVPEQFRAVGVSCHSPADVACVAAAKLRRVYITAGHIFDTDCKAGLPGRGLDFLRQMVAAANMPEAVLPVYAIGGVGPENIAEIKKAGAQGACLMSSFMMSPDPAGLLAQLRAAVD